MTAPDPRGDLRMAAFRAHKARSVEHSTRADRLFVAQVAAGLVTVAAYASWVATDWPWILAVGWVALAVWAVVLARLAWVVVAWRRCLNSWGRDIDAAYTDAGGRKEGP